MNKLNLSLESKLLLTFEITNTHKQGLTKQGRLTCMLCRILPVNQKDFLNTTVD